MENRPVVVQPSQEDIDQNRYIAILSYISILFLIPLLLRKDSLFCRFHVNQGIILFIISVIIGILNSLLSFLGIIFWVLRVAVFALAVWGIIQCFKGETVSFPVIGEIHLL